MLPKLEGKQFIIIVKDNVLNVGKVFKFVLIQIMIVNIKLHCGCIIDKDHVMNPLFLSNSYNFLNLSMSFILSIGVTKPKCKIHKGNITLLEQYAISGEIALSLR